MGHSTVLHLFTFSVIGAVIINYSFFYFMPFNLRSEYSGPTLLASSLTLLCSLVTTFNDWITSLGPYFLDWLVG
jgi:hypothetical protein